MHREVPSKTKSSVIDISVINNYPQVKGKKKGKSFPQPYSRRGSEVRGSLFLGHS